MGMPSERGEGDYFSVLSLGYWLDVGITFYSKLKSNRYNINKKPKNSSYLFLIPVSLLIKESYNKKIYF